MHAASGRADNFDETANRRGMQRRTHAAATRAALLSLLVAATAAPALALPANGIVAALLKDGQFADCAAKSKTSRAAYVAKAFTLEPVRLHDGKRVVVATGADACVCAAQNCPTLVLLAQSGGRYRTVLSDWAIAARVTPDGYADLSAHDTAAVSNRTLYRWNGTRYAIVKSERVDLRSGAVRPMSVALAFAPGTSSATRTGTAALGFGDTYTLRARAGQVLALSLTTPGGKPFGHALLLRGTDTLVADAGARWRGTLSATGDYAIAVEGDGESLAPYRLTVTIR